MKPKPPGDFERYFSALLDRVALLVARDAVAAKYGKLLSPGAALDEELDPFELAGEEIADLVDALRNELARAEHPTSGLRATVYRSLYGKAEPKR